jgi:hypothetical protein
MTMLAFVIVLTLLNALALVTRINYVSGKRPRPVLSRKQEIFGLCMTAIFFLWGVAILLFGW